MQRQVRVQSSVLSDGECFDMWHDYMNLCRLMERLRESRETDHGGSEWPEKDAAAAEGLLRHVHTCPRGDRKNSVESSSASSLSDTSSSGTSSDLCRFCKQNGESVAVYRSHKLKSNDGKVICPVLRRYTCPTCEATGDQAHTRRYCPRAQPQEAAKMLQRSKSD